MVVAICYSLFDIFIAVLSNRVQVKLPTECVVVIDRWTAQSQPGYLIQGCISPNHQTPFNSKIYKKKLECARSFFIFFMSSWNSAVLSVMLPRTIYQLQCGVKSFIYNFGHEIIYYSGENSRTIQPTRISSTLRNWVCVCHCDRTGIQTGNVIRRNCKLLCLRLLKVTRDTYLSLKWA